MSLRKINIQELKPGTFLKWKQDTIFYVSRGTTKEELLNAVPKKIKKDKLTDIKDQLFLYAGYFSNKDNSIYYVTITQKDKIFTIPFSWYLDDLGDFADIV